MSFICNKHQIQVNETIGIGNDFNDVDMLEVTGNSFIVANAPSELKMRYERIPSNQDDAFAFVAAKMFGTYSHVVFLIV